MRGNALHNSIANDARDACSDLGIHSHLEYSIMINGRYLYLDVAAWLCDRLIAIEIETSLRHIDSTVAKARELGLELLIVVPRRKLRRQVANKLKKLYSRTLGKQPGVVLLDELKAMLTHRITGDITANC
jgi:hypothetical protein